jgi:lysophospholipase L1-like esterase
MPIAHIAGSGPSLVAALGDSITAYSTTGAVNVNQLSYQPHGFMTWAMGFSMGALWCPLVGTPNNSTALLNYNRAVSGETAEQAFARVTEIDSLPVKPRFCSVLVGTNNLTSNPTQTSASIASVIISICAALIGRGITPILCTLLPRGNGTASGWGSLSAGQIATARINLMDVNRRLRQYSASTPGVILADTYYALLDFSNANSDPISTLTGHATTTPDYLHPNVPGAQAVGKVWWDAVIAYTTKAPRNSAGTGDAYSATNPYGSMWDSSFNTNGGTASAPVTAAPAWAATTAYVANNIVVTGGKLYRCVVGGTSGATAPVHTSGQALDGTVLWEFQASGALAGAPVGWTSARQTGTASSAVVSVQQRADGLAGYESTISISPSTDASTIYQQYTTSSGGGLPDANFSPNDVIYLEFEATVDCGSALCYGTPDIRFRANTSAYVGTFQFYCNQPSAGVQTHPTGKFSVLFRSPLLDLGPTGATGFNGILTMDGARTGGTGAVNVTRRNNAIRKYNKLATGAVTW